MSGLEPTWNANANRTVNASLASESVPIRHMHRSKHDLLDPILVGEMLRATENVDPTGAAGTLPTAVVGQVDPNIQRSLEQ
jgi:hypothetical protein